MKEHKWEPASPDVEWMGTTYWLDGEKWPERIQLRAWERNEAGERRITAERTYVLEDTDDV